MAELQDMSVESKMLEVEQASINVEAQARLSRSVQARHRRRRAPGRHHGTPTTTEPAAGEPATAESTPAESGTEPSPGT